MVSKIDINKSVPRERWGEFFDQFSSGGIGSLATTTFMIRDSRLPGGNIFILEAKPLLGRSMDRAGNPGETVEPETVEPETVEPETVEPEIVEPETVEPEIVEPEIVEPETVEPETVEPETVEPETVEPETVEPETV
ncbi:oleate hydratase, partial [Nostoc sp.]|uniref:oleate hydratase n=1 Tax=Nostoc sp. TaxID=1180 RepID=UPI002FFC1EB7